jgi:flavin-binding protein dodecin
VERVKWRGASESPLGGRDIPGIDIPAVPDVPLEVTFLPTRSFIPPPRHKQERNVTLATYKKIEVVGTSSKSVADAIKSAVSGAGKTLRNMSWFEVAEIRGAIKGDNVSEFQVTVRIGFKVES